jgi:hypothetical protein
MTRKYLILIIIFAVFGSFAHAQVRNTDIVLDISPQYPNQNQNVTATLSSYATNLDKAHISWSTNNQETSEGIGKKVFYFTTGNLGSSLTLTATINTVDGQSIQKTIIVISADIDMLWEASDSYAPPFYKGRTLAPSQGAFKVVAMPSLINNGGKVNVNNLSYVWTKDGDIQPDSSGWGKNFFIFQNSYLDKENIVEVKVSDITGGANTAGTIQLQTSIPEIVFYEDDPLLGVRWENALKDGARVNREGETLVAEPYFFSPKNINSPDLALDWFLNGEQIQIPNPKNMLSIKPENGQSGNAIIRVVVNNINTLFQSLEKQINVQF